MTRLMNVAESVVVCKVKGIGEEFISKKLICLKRLTSKENILMGVVIVEFCKRIIFI